MTIYFYRTEYEPGCLSIAIDNRVWTLSTYGVDLGIYDQIYIDIQKLILELNASIVGYVSDEYEDDFYSFWNQNRWSAFLESRLDLINLTDEEVLIELICLCKEFFKDKIDFP